MVRERPQNTKFRESSSLQLAGVKISYDVDIRVLGHLGRESRVNEEISESKVNRTYVVIDWKGRSKVVVNDRTLEGNGGKNIL